VGDAEIVGLAVAVGLAVGGATVVRADGHAALLGELGAVEVVRARRAGPALHALLAKQALCPFGEARAVLAEIGRSDAGLGRLSAELAVALAGAADGMRVMCNAAVVSAGAVGIGLAVEHRAVGVGIALAFRETGERLAVRLRAGGDLARGPVGAFALGAC